MLTNVDLQKYLAELGAKADVIKGLTPEQIAAMLLDQARTADHAGARVRAMELLGKWRGMFREELTVTTKLPVSALLLVVAKTHPDLAAELGRLLGADEGESR